MGFGQDFICWICKNKPVGDYRRWTSNFAGIDVEFYTCSGDCAKKFVGEYVEPFVEIETRFEILDL